VVLSFFYEIQKTAIYFSGKYITYYTNHKLLDKDCGIFRKGRGGVSPPALP
jgi:hypothetical protein